MKEDEMKEDEIIEELNGTSDPLQPEQTASSSIDELKAQLDDYKDKYFRAHAEIDNIRKRMAREREEVIKYSNEKILNDFLRIYDAFEKSIISAQEHYPDDDSLIAGLKMIEKLCMDTLKRHHVIPIDAKGLPFDPNYHEALMQVDSEEQQIEGIVVDEFEKGFRHHERVLRPSKVSVSKGR